MRPLVVTEALDINTAPSCGRTMDQDMILGNSPGPDDVTRVQAATQTLGISMVLDGIRSYGQQHRPWLW